MKRLAFFGTVAVMAAASWGALVACSSSDGGSTFSTDKGDGAVPSSPGFGDSTTNGDGGAGTVTCTTSLSTTFAPTYLAPATPAGQCAAEELGGYFDACLAGGASASCKAWRDAHPGCTACIEPDGGAGPIQTYADHKYSQTNLGGCYAIATGNAAEGGACAKALQGADQCAIDACLSCIEKDGVTNDAIASCKTKARSSGCSSYQSAITTACPAGYAGADGGAWDCFPHSATEQSTDTRTWLVRMMGVYCGAAPR